MVDTFILQCGMQVASRALHPQCRQHPKELFVSCSPVIVVPMQRACGPILTWGWASTSFLQREWSIADAGGNVKEFLSVRYWLTGAGFEPDSLCEFPGHGVSRIFPYFSLVEKPLGVSTRRMVLNHAPFLNNARSPDSDCVPRHRISASDIHLFDVVLRDISTDPLRLRTDRRGYNSFVRPYARHYNERTYRNTVSCDTAL